MALKIFNVLQALLYAEKHPMKVLYCVANPTEFDVTGIRCIQRDTENDKGDYLFEYTTKQRLQDNLARARWYVAIDVIGMLLASKALFAKGFIPLQDGELAKLAGQCGCQTDNANRMVRALDVKMTILNERFTAISEAFAH